MSPEIVESVRHDLRLAVARMRRAAKAIPVEHHNWSPAPSARTPVELVFHSAMALEWIGGLLKGHPYPTPTTEIADREFRAMEAQQKDMGAMLELLKDKAMLYNAILDEVKDLDEGTLLEMPFALGQAPLRLAVTAAVRHTHDHAAQLDYLQTILGDRSW